MITKKRIRKELILDIDGPDGNAFVLLAAASKLSKRLELDEDKVIDEMRSSDYIHLLKTFDKYFGSIVVLETSNEEYLEIFKK